MGRDIDNGTVDRVAEALCNKWSGDDEAWEGTFGVDRERWRRQALAVVDTLDLIQEQADRPVLTYDDPPAPKGNPLVAGPDRVWATHYEFIPSIRVVSEWEPRMIDADSMRAWEPSP